MVVGIDKIGVVRQPAKTEYYQDHNEHLSKLKYIISIIIIIKTTKLILLDSLLQERS